MTDFRTLDDAQVAGKRVLVRVDLNVPIENGRVTDATRIERVVPTHPGDRRQGRQGHPAGPFRPPEGRARTSKNSLRPVAAALADEPRPAGRLRARDGRRRGRARPSRRCRTATSCCSKTPAFTRARKRTTRTSSTQLAELGDLYVNDAFSAAHRAHASTEGLARKLPAYAGRTMQAELAALPRALEKPERPVAAIVGGAKVSTKLDLLGNLVSKVDILIIGGGMANTFLAAQGKAVGKSLCEHDLADTARKILAEAGACEIVLPVDAVVAKRIQGARALARRRRSMRSGPTT